MKITLTAQVQENPYDYKNRVVRVDRVEKEMSLTTEIADPYLLPWDVICRGLVEAALREYFSQTGEADD